MAPERVFAAMSRGLAAIRRFWAAADGTRTATRDTDPVFAPRWLS